MGPTKLTYVDLPITLDTVGKRIRWARKRLNWTQEELAKALGADQTTVSKWEKDLYVPRDFKALAEALEIPSPAWLAFGKATIDQLSKDALELAESYDNLTPEQQTALLSLLRSMQ